MRVIKHGRHRPFVLKLQDLGGFQNMTDDKKILNYEVHICACGLSRHKPFCDGSHAKTGAEAEGKLYRYTLEEEAFEIKETEELAKMPDEYPD